MSSSLRTYRSALGAPTVSMLSVLALLALLTSAAQSAELSQDTSLFSKPSVGSKQIEILSTGTHVEATGPSLSRDGLNWTPVEADGKAGYVMTSAIAQSTQSPNDTSDSNEPTEQPETKKSRHPGLQNRMRFWIGEGIASINSYTNYIGNDFSFGAAVSLMDDRRLFLGLEGEGLGSGEYSPDSNVLGIHRHNLFAEIGYKLIPDSLYVLARGGLSGIAVDSPSSAFLAQWIGGVSVGMPIYRINHFGLSGQFNYTYTPSVSTASTPIAGDFGAALGLPSGTVSSASVVSLQLLFNFYL